MKLWHIVLVLTAVALLVVGTGVVQDAQQRLAESTRRASLSATPAASVTPTPSLTPTPTITPTSTPTPIPTPAPGPSFLDNCEQNPSTQWDTSFGGSGTWLATNGRCVFLPDLEKQLNLAVVGFPYWRDYVVDVDVHYTRDDMDDYCGVVVLAENPRNYFYFSMGGRYQRVEWWMQIDGQLAMVPETQWKSALKDDTDHHVRVEVSGGNIVTYLDKTEVARFGTRLLDSGSVGLLAYSDGASPNNLCAFDSFEVSPLQP